MKVNISHNFFFALTVFILLLSFNCAKKERVLVVIDASKNTGFQHEVLVKQALTTFKENYSNNILISVKYENDAFNKVIEDRSSYIAGLKDLTGDPVSFVFCIRPDNTKSGIIYEASFFSVLAKGEIKEIKNTPPGDTEDLIKFIGENFIENKFDPLKVINFLRNPPVLSRVAISIDNKKNVAWAKDEFINSVKNFFSKKYESEPVFDISENPDSFKSIKENTPLYVDNLNKNKYTENEIFYFNIQPLYDDDKNVFLEIFFATNYSDRASLTVKNSGWIKSSESVLAEIEKNFTFYNYDKSRVCYLWQKGLTITSEVITLLSFKELDNDKKNQYIIINKMPGIFENGKISYEKLIVNNKINLSGNDIISKTVNFINDSELSRLFYDSTNKLTGTRIIFIEFVTTGDRYFKVLFGPVSSSNFQNITKSFNDKGVSVYSKLVYMYDFY